MRLRDYIRSELVFTDLNPRDNRDLLRILSERIGEQIPELDRDVLMQKLWEREQKMCTGLECGIAIPHAMVPGLSQAICAIARLREPMNFGSVDGKPIQVIFCLISPDGAVASHVRILARIARFCSMTSFIERVIQAADGPGLFAIVTEEDERHV